MLNPNSHPDLEVQEEEESISLLNSMNITPEKLESSSSPSQDDAHPDIPGFSAS